MVSFMENPDGKMDDEMGVALFQETSIYIYVEPTKIIMQCSTPRSADDSFGGSRSQPGSQGTIQVQCFLQPWARVHSAVAHR